MKITKLGHCALVLEVDGVKVLTDPGSFTVPEQAGVLGVDIVLITHEHGDHFHVESVRTVLQNNPGAVVVTNASVAKLIGEHNINCTVQVVGDGQSATIGGILIEGLGKDHAPIYKEVGLVENTGYFVGGKFFFPGDAFHNPGRSVDVLALPVAGPWMKISEAIDYAFAVKPRVAFPVHDGMYLPDFGGFVHSMGATLLTPGGVEFVSLKAGETKEF